MYVLQEIFLIHKPVLGIETEILPKRLTVVRRLQRNATDEGEPCREIPRPLGNVQSKYHLLRVARFKGHLNQVEILMKC